MSVPRPVVSLVLLLGLVSPFGAVAYGAGALVGPLSRGTANVLLGLVAPLSPRGAPPVADLHEPEAAEVEVAAPTVASSRKAPRPGGPWRPSAAPPPKALFVSSTKVLELAQSAARPQGAFVAQTGEHPAGLRLGGVGALGIGVQDGDILVEALGLSPRAPGELIGAIIEARAKNARFLSGTLWRRGQTFRITVEQPYLPAKG